MPRIIPEHLKKQAIILFFLGYSRDEISQKLGISTGTVSKYLEEFRREIDNTTFEAIKAWGRFLSKNQILPTDAMTGIRISKLIQRYNIDEENLNLFFENLSSINVDSGVTQLLQAANQLLEIEKTTGKSHQATLAEFDKLSKAIPVLENSKQDLESAIQILDEQREDLFKQNKTTEKEISQFIVIKSEYGKIGLKLDELLKYHKALVEIKRHGYDATKLLNYLQKIENLQKHIETCEKIYNDCCHNIELAKKEIKSLSTKLEQLKLEYKQFSIAIKIIQEFVRNRQDPSTIIHWNQILEQNQLTVSEFDKKLKEYNGLIIYLKQLSSEVHSLTKRKQALVLTVNNLEKEIQKLSTLIKRAKVELDQKIIHTTKEIEHLEATNPLRLVYDSRGEPHKVFSTTIIFLEKLKGLLEKKNIRKSSLRHAIDRLIKELNTELKK